MVSNINLRPYIEGLKKSDRAKQFADKSVDFATKLAEDPNAVAERLKSEAKKVWDDEKLDEDNSIMAAE